MVKLEDIHSILMRAEYPATREELLQQVQRMQASPEILARLETLTEHMYGSVDTVMDTLRNLD